MIPPDQVVDRPLFLQYTVTRSQCVVLTPVSAPSLQFSPCSSRSSTGQLTSTPESPAPHSLALNHESLLVPGARLVTSPPAPRDNKTNSVNLHLPQSLLGPICVLAPPLQSVCDVMFDT